MKISGRLCAAIASALVLLMLFALLLFGVGNMAGSRLPIVVSHGEGRADFSAHGKQKDAVVALPPGAVLLATGDRYPHQAFRLGGCAWGLQYHPEVSAADWDEWMTDYHGALHPEGLHPGEVAAAMSAAQAHLAVLAEAHVEAFVAACRNAAEPGTGE